MGVGQGPLGAGRLGGGAPRGRGALGAGRGGAGLVSPEEVWEWAHVGRGL